MKPGDAITPIKNYTFRHPHLPGNAPKVGIKYYVEHVFEDGMILISGHVGLWNASNFKIVK